MLASARILGVGCAAVLFGLASLAAAEPSSEACTSAYESNQQLRKDGKLVAAREPLLLCVQQACPDFVRPDCEKWLAEVERQTPTIVFAAKSADGRDLVDVRVFVDGVERTDSLDGRALGVDPGPHKLRFEHGDGPPREMSVVLAQGVKDRVVTVSFAGPEPGPSAGPAPLDPAPSPTSAPAPDRGEVDRGQPILAYVFGGLGLGGFAAFAALGIIGRNEASDLDELCAQDDPGCTQEAIDSTRTKLVAADVSLGIGAGLLGVGIGLFIYHFVSEPETPAAAWRIDANPLPGGGFGSLSVPF
jgi:hypothetical protein